MSQRYDVIVIGAGHNGLTTAALLARAGRRVLVIERRDVVGGLAAADEFHPGYRTSGVFQDTTMLSRRVADELQLTQHGLVWRAAPPDVLALGAPGDSLLLSGDNTRAIATRNPHDAEQYSRYRAALARLRPLLAQFLTAPPIDPTSTEALGVRQLLRPAVKLRRQGRRDLLEFFRLPPLCVADWLDEWFEDDLLKAALALPPLASTFLAPRSPGGTALLLRQAGLAGPGIVGGGPALVAALERAARAHGVEVRTGAKAARVRTADTVQGVTLEDGETIDAAIVAASCHPKSLFLELLPPRSLPARFAHRIESYRSRGTTAQVLLGLRSPLRYKGHEDVAIEFARTGGSLLDIERAFDAIKYGRVAERPVLEIHAPTAPAAAPVAAILVHYVPHAATPAWDDKARERLGDRVQELLEAYTTGLDVTGRRVLVPPDFETKFALPGGNLHHGDHSIDQLLLRPAAGCIGYRTPIPGLYLCGSGSHPGGGLTCLPGALAARTILGS